MCGALSKGIDKLNGELPLTLLESTVAVARTAPVGKPEGSAAYNFDVIFAVAAPASTLTLMLVKAPVTPAVNDWPMLWIDLSAYEPLRSTGALWSRVLEASATDVSDTKVATAAPTIPTRIALRLRFM
jgi:hypothetical protein